MIYDFSLTIKFRNLSTISLNFDNIFKENAAEIVVEWIASFWIYFFLLFSFYQSINR